MNMLTIFADAASDLYRQAYVGALSKVFSEYTGDDLASSTTFWCHDNTPLRTHTLKNITQSFNPLWTIPYCSAIALANLEEYRSNRKLQYFVSTSLPRDGQSV